MRRETMNTAKNNLSKGYRQRSRRERVPSECRRREHRDQLYSEASVRAYRPEAVLVELTDGSRIPALCFNLIVQPGPEEANSEYSAQLRDLARRLGFPIVPVVDAFANSERNACISHCIAGC